MEIITKESPRWFEFIFRLNNRLKEWDCTHSHDQSWEALTAMGGVDVNGSIQFFYDHGGHCDCEVMFNLVDWDAEV